MTEITDTPAFEVINTRRLPFSPARVFQAFADPDQLQIWWGPEGFTNRFDTFDLRVGGSWLFTMINENDREFPIVKEFIEVTPERIIMKHIQPMHDFVMTITFQPAPDETTDLRWIMDFAPGQDDGLATFLEAANEQNFDRLETHLKTL